MPERRPNAAAFPVTRWTLILRAPHDPASRRVALETLLSPRWSALYALARRRGLGRDDAQDAVQSFAERLLDSDAIERLDPARGKLRSYLAAAFSRHLVNLHQEATALKRGGGLRTLPIDAMESWLGTSQDNPERAFDRAFALAQYRAALADLRTEYECGGRTGPFEVLEAVFQFGETDSYAELAARYGLSSSQLKSIVHRGKQRFRQLFRARVAETVEDPADVDAELATLLELLGAG